MRKLTVLICLLVILLTSCTQGSSVTPESTLTITQTPIATATFTPSPTSTPVPPLEGRLFFDMNGSGLPDEATFNYDEARLNSPINQIVRAYISAFPDSYYQPERLAGLEDTIEEYISAYPDALRDETHPVLLKVIDDYVSAHPGIEDGDLITMDEPGLPGYTVCVQSECAQTDQEGSFSLPNASGASRASIKITDPYADFPAWAMRYINDWKGAVTVPAYTKDIDAATMARLTTIPLCDADLEALVCKLDEDTLQVRDQHLNDTSIIPIAKGTSIKSGQDNNIGLMQGFLTLPFVSEQVPKPFIWGYFDIIGKRILNDNITYNDTQDGIILNYDGKYNLPIDFSRVLNGEHFSGVGDSHTGLDILLPMGTYELSALPTSKVLSLAGPPSYPEFMTFLWFENPNNPANHYMTVYGHQNNQLVNSDQTVYRGQIIGLSGNSGVDPPPCVQQVHFDLEERIPEGWFFIDPFRTIITLNPLPDNYWGSPASWWTSDNNPQFSLP